jgi:hypothetical protein
MTTTTNARTAHRVAGRIVAGLAAGGAAVAFSLAGATAASAQSYSTTVVAPGTSVCSSPQYASYQVRADGWATGQGAKFKLLRNGVVVQNTPSRANVWAAELRSSYGTFPGPGTFTVCAQNTGTANTTVTIQLRSDYEF